MQDVKELGWDELDVILISGDAYIDHAAFGVALLGRYLVHKGFRVGIIAQPQTDNDYLALGRPLLFFGISSGNVDSMVNHYTAQKKIRSEDDFSPNNKAGLRPDRAVLAYTQKVKQLFKGVITVIGGVEASLRRIPHYDFWSDKIKNSLLVDSKASILVYGNAERQILEIAERLKQSRDVEMRPATSTCLCEARTNPDRTQIEGINGTCIYTKEKPENAIELVNYPDVDTADGFYQMTKTFYNSFPNKILYYKYLDRYLVHFPPAEALNTNEIDEIYSLPFVREPHPMYKGKIIKAFEQIKCSILSHRGCYGGCSFCAIGIHQGKKIQFRSKESILKEIEKLSKKSYFKGTITDIGGASANMYGTGCKVDSSCSRLSCLCPDICKNLAVDDKAYLSVLKATKRNSRVDNIFISSGIRFDLALLQPEFTKSLCFYHTSGLLKLAPEHVSQKVLKMMNKPGIDKYLQFADIFIENSKKIDKKQYIIPYLIVGFPGCTTEDALELAKFLKKHNLKVEQIQEFTPTPMTIATMMYYTGIDFYSGEKIYVPKRSEVRKQKEMAQWFRGEARKSV